MGIELHPEARAEIRSATLWYEERRESLGAEFMAAVDGAFQSIGEAPKRYPRWSGAGQASAVIRKAAVERFPYVIAFEERKHSILVLAVAHQKRRPLYWLSRAGKKPG